MEIILLKDVDKVGDKFEIVNVKNGFGLNYLIPQKLGVIANDSNKKRRAEMIRREEAYAEKMLDEYQELADKLNNIVLKIGAKSGTSGKIFGSVTNVQIAQALKDQEGIDIERRKISLDEDVKQLGTYSAHLNLHKSIDSRIHFEVVKE
ncbi:MAG: 50S ribosomal protein L9 [Bacteroidetes bacterium]|jgi:large subunit ribosomal protein L9|nr:50S ribosomal protein L9 [Bacteroidota bacterium]